MRVITFKIISVIVLLSTISSCRHYQIKDSGQIFESIDTTYSSIKKIVYEHPDSALKFLHRYKISFSDSVYQSFVDTYIAKTHYFGNNFDSVLYYYNKVSRYCNRQKPSADLYTVQAMKNNLYGVFLQTKNNRDSALFYYTKAYEECRKASYKKDLINICINASDICRQMGKSPDASLWLRNALSYSDSLGNRKALHSIYCELGLVYSDLSNFKMAKECFYKSENIYPPSSEYEKYFLYNSMGNSAYMNKKYKEAMNYFKKSYSAAQKLNFASAGAIVEANMGEVFIYLNQTDSARFYLDKCKDYFVSTPDFNDAIKFYLNGLYAALELNEGNFSRAKHYLMIPFNIKSIGPSYLYAYNKRLMEYYSKTGDYKNAYKYRLAVDVYDDSLRNANYLNSVAEIGMRYSRDTTLLRRNVEIARGNAEIFKLRSLLITVIVLIMLIVISAFVLSYYKKAKREKESEKQRAFVSKLRMENMLNRFSPHFVFNVLNLVMPSLQKEQSAPIEKLVKLLRYNLLSLDSINVKLEDEINMAKEYTLLSNMVNSKIPVLKINIAKEVDMNSSIPAMCIQLPVENAIKHAFPNDFHANGKPEIIVDILKIDDMLELRIKDNGVGYSNAKNVPAGKSTGNGLKILNGVIILMNENKNNKITLTVKEDKGMAIILRIPQNQ